MDKPQSSLQPISPIFNETRAEVQSLFSMPRTLYRLAILISFFGIFVIEAIEPASLGGRAALGLAGTLLIIAFMLFVSITEALYFLRRIILNAVSEPENSNDQLIKKFGFAQLHLLENELSVAIGDSSVTSNTEWTRKLLPTFLAVIAIDCFALIFTAPIISVKIFAIAFLCHLVFAVVFEKVIRRLSDLVAITLHVYPAEPKNTNYPRNSIAYNSMPKFNLDDEQPNVSLNEPPTH